MSLLSILNLSLGFFWLLLSSCAGLFLATDTASAFLVDPDILKGWQNILKVSAHGHTALFGQIQILFALSLPHAHASQRLQKLQTVGISAGVFAMSVLMVLRSVNGPASSFDVLGLCIGGCLTAFMLSLGSHWALLTYRVSKKCAL
ncbi:MAG: hypothetical protein AB8C84_07285 [Oligoflexales bacterium]